MPSIGRELTPLVEMKNTNERWCVGKSMTLGDSVTSLLTGKGEARMRRLETRWKRDEIGKT